MPFDLLALCICIVWAVAILTIDLMTFQISNSSLAWGLILVWPSLYLLDQRFRISFTTLVLMALTLAAGLASLIGMGDVKLVLFLAPWLHYQNMRNPLIAMMAVSWLQLMGSLLFQRNIPKRIAFAPAILVAAALNMAT